MARKRKNELFSALDINSPIRTPDFSDLMERWQPSSIQMPRVPSKPWVCHWGFWQGEHGAWLEFKGIASESDARFLTSAEYFGKQPTIEIVGTAINQKVQGYAVRTGDNVKIHLWLVSKRHWIDLDLEVEQPYHTHLKGNARNPEGETIPVDLTLVAPNIAGSWKEDGGTSLSFSRGSLQWDEDKQKVKGEAWGTLFGRYGEGKFEFYSNCGCSVLLRATDDIFRRWCQQQGFRDVDRMEDWELNHHYLERYQASGTQEAWWGSDSVLMHLDVSADHLLLDGTVSPVLHKYEREAPLHLAYVPPVESASGKKGLL